MSVHDDVMAMMSALDDWDRRRAILALLDQYYICLEGTRLIIDGEASDLYLVSKSEQSPCENCNEEFVRLGQEFCEHCDDTSIPCPACGTVPPDDYCADCDIIVSHNKCDDCQPREWTCDGCLDLVPDGAGYYVNDMRVCEGCAEKLQREGS